MSKKKRETSDIEKALKTIQFGVEERAINAAAAKLHSCLEPRMRGFIFGRLDRADAEDVLQETMKGIFKGLFQIKGLSDESLFAWCYAIARNKINDHLRKHISRRIEPLPPEEIAKYVEESQQSQPLSPRDKLDCEYAMDLLAKSKPECREYLWNRFMADMDYFSMAKMYEVNADTMRMRINRCLETARELLS